MTTVLLLLLLTQGGPPLLTDDTATPGDGHTELNVAFTVEKFRDLTLYEVPLLDFNYGIGERIQLKAEVPWVIGRSDSVPDASGLGNLLVGVKYRFVDQVQAGVAASVYPQGEIITSAHSRQRGLVEEHRSLLLPVEVARRIGPVDIGGEVGYRCVEEDRDDWVWGVAVAYEPVEDLEILGEIHGETEAGFRHGELVWNVGARIKLSELNTLLLSAGRGIRGASRSEPDVLGYLGLQFNF